jgi:hypothetical protein
MTPLVRHGLELVVLAVALGGWALCRRTFYHVPLYRRSRQEDD